MNIKKPNHIGIPVGEVIGYNSNKGYVKVKLAKELNLGDSIAICDSSCKISELMKGNNNIKSANKGEIVILGRIKGKIKNGDKVYRTVLDKLNKEIVQISGKENIKRPIDAKIYLKEDEQLKLEIKDLWTGLEVIVKEETKVNKAENNGISKQRIEEQLSKTGNTPFGIRQIEIVSDDNVIVPISTLNSIRRNALEELEGKIINSFKRNKKAILKEENEGISKINSEVKVSLLLNNIKDEMNYCELTNIDNVYIPFRFFISNKEKVNEITKDVDVTKDVFNVYVSGIDSYGNVTDKTRSDVNIILSINPKTNKILMINIPRDYYVELDGTGQKDKLTHAGIYGVEMSTKTIENLLGIEINYYVKVNYNALINLVDALGGVDVYSKNDFTSGLNYHFNVGYNHVNGDQALEFVRTRKAFLDGDRVRGENQQAMIQAVIKKACSASILIKYDDILKSLEDSFSTNISTDKIMSLINMQLDSMPSWNIESISLNGSDSYGFTYTYPTQELYVMIPNEETIDEAKNALNAIS